MLYVCATPIGNLGDASPRLVDTLRAVSVIACEDTRHTLKLLSHFGIKGPRLVSLHEHNEQERLPEMLAMLSQGEDVALVSDAGTPTLSDPGFRLIRASRNAGLPVTVVPGPSAAVAALALSGLPTDRALLAGFLPRSRKDLEQLLGDAAAARATLVAFESPRRLRASLTGIGELAPGSEVAVCRELTKLHEQVLTGTAQDVAARLPEPLRGEIVVLVAPQEKGHASADRPAASRETLLQDLMQEGFPTKDIASALAQLTGIGRKEAYAMALAARHAVREADVVAPEAGAARGRQAGRPEGSAACQDGAGSGSAAGAGADRAPAKRRGSGADRRKGGE